MGNQSTQENTAAVSVGSDALVSNPVAPGYHELKTWPDYFWAVARGDKKFELRENDRDFQRGDSVRLKEWDNVDERYTGREIVARIGYITSWQRSLREGHVCFALENVILC